MKDTTAIVTRRKFKELRQGAGRFSVFYLYYEMQYVVCSVINFDKAFTLQIIFKVPVA